MTDDVFQPFEADVEEQGGYVYASSASRSAEYSNRRFSNVTISALSFAGKRVVDVGCGDGTYTALLGKTSGAESVLGIDPATKAIDRAKATYTGQVGNVEFKNCFSSDLVSRNLHFDIAVYRGVIHHVGDPAAEIANALKIADDVFFLEPNGWNPVLKILEKVSPYHRRHKERSYIMKRYIKWIENAGGRVVKVFYFGLVPMFSPACMVSIGAFFEPLVEKVPVIRTLACGQVGIVAKSSVSPDI